MAPSILCIRTGLVSLLAAVSKVAAQSVPGGTLFVGGGIPGSGSYTLVDDYEPSIFFNKFNFYNVGTEIIPGLDVEKANQDTPISLMIRHTVMSSEYHRRDQYVSKDVAVTNGYVQTNSNSVIIKPDTTNAWPNGGPGRPSVRIVSDNTYTHGLFLLDLTHMPHGCGTWPAYWLVGPNWPSNGEIDIIEGVNTNVANSISLHSSPGCQIGGAGQSGIFETSNCDSNANGLSNVQGGVYATEWTSNWVKTWFFPRGQIPSSITNGAPDVSQFGLPLANQQAQGTYQCTIDNHFANQSVVINIDFCGAWAGQVYGYNSAYAAGRCSTVKHDLDIVLLCCSCLIFEYCLPWAGSFDVESTNIGHVQRPLIICFHNSVGCFYLDASCLPYV
ncbi:hypothetical protein LTR28_007439 [Elasticomyces elasticus]|nr:hypothetical protein LTR28_007439 [Elasticomyces elasticus]